MAELIYKDEVYAIVGAAMEVYNQLGSGFSEAIDQETLEIEISSRHVPYNPQQDIYVDYKGQTLKKFFTPGFNLLRQDYCRNQSVGQINFSRRISINKLP